MSGYAIKVLCTQCRKPFDSYRYGTLYCSNACRQAAYRQREAESSTYRNRASKAKTNNKKARAKKTRKVSKKKRRSTHP